MTRFEEIYRAYFNDVYRYLRRLSGDETLAGEITSETFFKAMRALDSFRGECDVRVWLCRIAKNCYYTYLKKASRTEALEDTAPWSLPSPAPGGPARPAGPLPGGVHVAGAGGAELCPNRGDLREDR